MNLPDRHCTSRCEIVDTDRWQMVRQARLQALSDSPDSFLGIYEEECLFGEDDWRKTFTSASWHAYLTDADIVGIARSVSLASYPDERYVESFWVRRDCRNRGIGQAILRSIIGEAAKEGRTAVRLSVLLRNESAIALFEHLGFTTDTDRSNENEVCLSLPVGCASVPVSPAGTKL